MINIKEFSGEKEPLLIALANIMTAYDHNNFTTGVTTQGDEIVNVSNVTIEYNDFKKMLNIWGDIKPQLNSRIIHTDYMED